MDRLFTVGPWAENMRLATDRVLWLQDNLPRLGGRCKLLQLPVTEGLIMQFYAKHETTAPTWRQAITALAGIKEAFKQELRTRLFLHIYPHRIPYYGGTVWQGPKITEFQKIFEAYSSSRFDVTEAGNCFCCERFTACVYHLMRVAEYGLVSLATTIGSGVPPKNASWDGMIRAIREHLNALSSGSSKPKDWKNQEQFYSEMSSWFTDIKNAWRNPVSHVPRAYDESQAEGMFLAVKNVMNLLATHGIRESAMPETIALPTE